MLVLTVELVHGVIDCWHGFDMAEHVFDCSVDIVADVELFVVNLCAAKTQNAGAGRIGTDRATGRARINKDFTIAPTMIIAQMRMTKEENIARLIGENLTTFIDGWCEIEGFVLPVRVDWIVADKNRMPGDFDYGLLAELAQKLGRIGTDLVVIPAKKIEDFFWQNGFSSVAVVMYWQSL